MKKIVSVILVALMMLFTAAMVVSASENAKEETMEKNLSATEHATEEVKEAENKTAEPAKAEGKEAPGFEGLLAVTGLAAAACLVLGRRA